MPRFECEKCGDGIILCCLECNEGIKCDCGGDYKPEVIYVMGGMYFPTIINKKGQTECVNGKRHFEIVRSSNNKLYISHFADGSMARLSLHHSHVYKLSDDRKSVTLVKESWCIKGDLPTPKKVELTKEQYKAVIEQIKVQNFYDMV